MKAFVTKLMGCAVFGLAASWASAGVIAVDTTYRAFDASSGHVGFDVTTHGLIKDLDVAITFSKCDNPYLSANGQACLSDNKPFENEIVIRLIGPDGRAVRLVNENTYDQGNTGGIGRVTVHFDDEGAALGRRVAAGSFRPLELLSLFDGMDMFGQWQLYFEDTKRYDPFEVYSSRLVFTEAPPSSSTDLPEPAGLLVFGAGLLGLAATRRRLHQQA